MAAHLKGLRKLYADLGQYDRAWCVASVLSFLRKADAEEQRFFEQYKPKTFARAKARLTEELWQRNLYHPDEDRFDLATCWPRCRASVAAIRAREHKDWGLKRKDRRDPATDQLLFSKVFNYVTQVLAVPQPELYLRPESPGELDMANAREKGQLVPAFVVGSALLQGRPEKDLAYTVGKKLTLMRPDHFVRWPHVVPTVGELKVVFLAALKLVQPNVPIKPELQQSVGQYLDLLRKTVPPQLAEQLAVVVQRFLETKSEADLHKLVERRRLHRHPRRLPDVRRPGRRRPPGPDRAGGGRQRRAQGEDPRPHPVDRLRRVLHAAGVPGAHHRVTTTDFPHPYPLPAAGERANNPLGALTASRG